MNFIKKLFGGGGKSTDPGVDFLIARGEEDLRTKTAAHAGIWGFGTEENWSLDQDTGELTFTFPDGKRATASAQIIGTLNTDDGTWLWSWANSSIDPLLTRDARALAKYGQEHGVAFLTGRKYTITEQRAWSLTALSVYVNGSQGAYRGPAGTTLVFMTFGEVRLSSNGGAG